ncbi:MAG: HlyD family efflux transporter periplasmic adaptor subunit [Roseiflexaceae bacterium]|nr:HlyD family efflux transporter periplasmic adaptor subunit [Roseiflexaceae bacterium]
MRFHVLFIPLLCAIGLTACGATVPNTATVPEQVTAVATVNAQPTAMAAPSAPRAIVGIGVVTAAREVDLNFTVSGTVAEVLVRRGDVVSATQLLARIDARRFERQVAQLEAAAQIAHAQAAGLDSPPRSAAIAAANAQVRQAAIVLAQTRVEQTQDNRTADATVAAAGASLQDTRDQLSAAKTSAELSLKQAVAALTQTQTDYSVAKRNWEIARDRSEDPITPELIGPAGEPVANRLSEGQRQQYYAVFVQAEAALRGAETAVTQAQVAFETARQAEVTGIQQAEQQATQAEAGRARQQLPAEIDRAAAAQAAVEAAQANLKQLYPAPTQAERAQAAANIALAEANLATAQIDLESVQLRAPFAGVVADVAIDPGDWSGATASAAVRIADTSTLRIDVRISDLDIARVREGQQVAISIEGMPNGRYSGRVRSIAPTATEEAGRRSFLVEVALDQQRGLRPGMSARAELASNDQATR